MNKFLSLVALTALVSGLNVSARATGSANSTIRNTIVTEAPAKAHMVALDPHKPIKAANTEKICKEHKEYNQEKAREEHR